jgi:chromosome segregation ATPase
MSYNEAMKYKELKAEHEILEQKYLKQSKELADVQARLEKYEDVNLEALTAERNTLKAELKTSQAEANTLQYTNESSARRVTSLEETITKIMADHHKFKQSVFEVFGLDKTTITKTNLEIMRVLQTAREEFVNEKAASKDHKEEIKKLTSRITELEKLLEAERKKAPSTSVEAQGNLLEQVKENSRLNILLERERSKYSILSKSVKIYREESERECDQLVQQLEAAHQELETVQNNLREMHQLATQTLTISTSTFSGISIAKQHKCKYSARIFDATMEESSMPLTPSTVHTPSTDSSRLGEPRRLVIA